MARQELQVLAFNRGLISKLALARHDLKRYGYSAEESVNWMPRALGSMMLRPGLGYKLSTNNNAATRYLGFVKSRRDKALMEFTTGALRIVINDVVLTRVAVAATVTNGNFNTNLTGWTDSDEVGATSDWVAGGYMGLTGGGTAAAIRDQQVIVTNPSVEHALRIVIERGPVTLRVGSTIGDDDYISEASLETGTHSLSFTPLGSFYVRFMSRLERITLVDSCNVEAAGAMVLPSPYPAADLGYIRGGWDISQSGDVFYLACKAYQQRRIERRGNARSWAIVLYRAPDGPFRAQNVSPTTLTPSVISGNGTLTASAPTFKATQVGALFSHTSTGQTVTRSATALNDATGSIEVTGVGTDRSFTIILSGVTAGRTIQLQRSFDNAVWTDVAAELWTADTTEAYADGLDNQTVFYRLKVTVAGAAGATMLTLTIATGSITGIGRVTAFSSSTVMQIEVLKNFGSTAASDEWAEGEWSDYRGWPSSDSFVESRLGWAGSDKTWLSVTDVFDGFDATVEGDSGPISRSIGSGPVETINWMLPLQRLLLGGDGAEYSVQSSALNDPLTPTAFNIKAPSTQGSYPIQALRIDTRGIFVQGGGRRLYELSIGQENGYDYTSSDLTVLIPEIGGEPGTDTHFVRIAVQRQPDTRIHCIRSDGTAGVMVYDRAENVTCWIELESPGAGGLIEDVVVLPATPGAEEDEVYYVVHRTVNGADVRYLEKFSLESECIGGTVNKVADSFVSFPSGFTATAAHLAGADLVVWADGICLTDEDGDIMVFTADNTGTITLENNGEAYFSQGGGTMGLAYEARWKGAKLGQALNHRKNISQVGLLLKDTHAKGIEFGPDFDHMDPLPLVYEGEVIDPDYVYPAADEIPLPFDGRWSPDSRVCLRATAPRPCTALATTIQMDVT